MRKFILWISLSIFLGIGTVALVTMGSGDASAIPKKKGYHCPPSIDRVYYLDEITDPDEYEAAERTDRNGNGYVCINPAGNYFDDNVHSKAKKKKVVKK